MAYRIRHWEQHFENHKTRLLKTLTWIPLPTDLGSAGYAELVGGHEQGAAHFGVWIALLEVAARGTPRGHLGDGRRPYSALNLALMCRMPEPLMEEAMERLVTIGWLETWHHQDALPPDQAPNPAGERHIKDDTGRQVGRKQTPLPPASQGDDALRAGEPTGANPRALGMNPRAQGTNPRAVGEREARAQARVGRHNPGTIHSAADLSHFEQEKPEPLDTETVAMLRQAIENPGLKPIAPPRNETLDERRERLRAQARAGEGNAGRKESA